ncbi:MAG: NAD(P)/FAD-dependent oxidoreductase, partial [Actinomycetota bacterium]|nr:NAD(P)/FAD-dependent oxidoreductase [Actinomycetota bacterium]
MSESIQVTDERRQELRERYLLERDKRLRADGNDQYIEPTGRFEGITNDPYTPVVEREAVHDDVTVAIIGAGFSGLVTGAALEKVGVKNVRLLDAAGDVGGVWYWNRYPGAMCDTAAMIYLPLLEETGTVPSAKYVPAHEIFAHAQRIATTFGLYENALLSTSATEVSWDADIQRWRITTDRGDNFTAKYVATGTGPLHRPKLPGIDGIDTFAGHAFHTSRWDYDYCGG